MEELSEIERRIANLTELGSVFGALRALSAARVHQARGALPGIDHYTATVHRSITLSLPDEMVAPEANGKSHARTLIVFCSEHGFVGGFNEELVERAKKALDERPARLLMIGSRGQTLAGWNRMEPDWACPMTTHIDGVLETARRVAAALYREVVEHGVLEACVIYGAASTQMGWHVEERPLLPFDTEPFRQHKAQVPPFTNLAPDVLVRRLIDELLFCDLVRAATQTLAAENIARLSAMTAARDSVTRTLATLRERHRRLRQSEITAEINEIIAGAGLIRAD